jgi:hypothetical protein
MKWPSRLVIVQVEFEGGTYYATHAFEDEGQGAEFLLTQQSDSREARAMIYIRTPNGTELVAEEVPRQVVLKQAPPEPPEEGTDVFATTATKLAEQVRAQTPEIF